MIYRRIIRLIPLGVMIYAGIKVYQGSRQAYPLGNTEMPSQERSIIVASRNNQRRN